MKILKYIKFTFLFSLAAICLTNCDDDDDVNIPEIVASFTQTIEDNRGTIRFINTSENAQTFAWDFGDGTTSTEINPTKQFAESGTYTVQMTASNRSGQSKSFSDQVTVEVVQDVTVPFDFDDDNVEFGVTAFNGASFEIVDNPDLSGTNTEASKVGAITNSGAAFEGIFFTLGAPIDLTTEKVISMNFWSQSPIDVLLKLEKTTGAAVETSASHGGTGWEIIDFTFNSSDQFSIFTIFVDGPGTTAGTFYFDDIEQKEMTGGGGSNFDSGLLTNGDFEAGAAPWIVGVDDNVPASVVTEDGNTYYSSGEITNPDPNAPFNVNVSQKLELVQGKTYTLTFDAWSDRSRSIIAGIGRSGGDFANVTETVSITDTRTTYTVTLTAESFGEADNRVLFDLNAEAGVVNIDNVSLKEDTGGGGGTFDSGLLTNGDFEAGATPWIVGVDDNVPASVVTEDGNTYYSSGEITNPDPNAPFNVNVSQKLALTDGTTYTLSFDAWSDRSRAIIAGIGRSGGDFANVTESVAITDTRTTYTVTLTASGFGEADNRVLFDLNAEAGVVNIDNVSLVEDAGSGGGGGTEVDEFCNTSVLHFGGDPASEVLVSIFNVDAQTMRIEVTSANDDPVDALVLPAGEWNPLPGISVGANDDDADGTWVAEFIFPDGAPATVDLYFLWSKVSTEGNWQSHDRAPEAEKRFATVDFNAMCDTGGGGGGGSTFDSGLLTNGDFEAGAAPWIVGVDDNVPATVETMDDNTFYTSGEITNPDPNAAFNVNLSQKLALTDGTTYTLSFDAWSDRSRDIIAGIGRSGGDFANVTETVSITDTRTTYTVTLTASGFGEADNRVLFDLNAEAGVVNIDNVSLKEDAGSGGGGGGSSSTAQIAVNGDFEANDGDGSGWMFFVNGGTAEIDNVVFNGGAYSAKIATNGATNPGVKQERVGAGQVQAGDVIQVQFDHIGATGGDGGVFNVILFGEGATEVSFTEIFDPRPTLTDSWATFTATFTIPDGADVTQGVSLLIESVCGAAAGCTVSANVDNVTITVNPE